MKKRRNKKIKKKSSGEWDTNILQVAHIFASTSAKDIAVFLVLCIATLYPSSKTQNLWAEEWPFLMQLFHPFKFRPVHLSSCHTNDVDI